MKNKLNEVETQIVSIYLVQMLGQPTIKQVHKVAKEKMGLGINTIEIKNSLNAGKKRGILSVGHVQNPKTKELEDAFSMKDVRFANPPEIAHIKNVLPKLMEDKGAKEIFDMMDKTHTEGERKSGRLPDIRDYKTIKVKFKNIVHVLGGKPFENTKGDKVNAENHHRRIGKKIWIPGNLMLRSAIRSKLRQHNINESKALYIDITDYFFVPKQKMGQEICPSPPQRPGMQGTGLTTYEALQPGEIFEFTIRFPTKNGISLEIMKTILNSNLRIGAKHKDYGLLELVECKLQ